MTGDTSRCDYYKKNSQNKAKKSHCVSNFHELPIEARNADKNSKVDQHFRKYPVPQTEEECEVNIFFWIPSNLVFGEKAEMDIWPDFSTLRKQNH